MVLTSQGPDEDSWSGWHQSLDSSQATSGHRHFWFVPNGFFQKSEFVTNLQAPGDSTQKSHVLLRSHKTANWMSLWNNWLALPHSQPGKDASIPRVLTPRCCNCGLPASFIPLTWMAPAGSRFVTSVQGELFINGLLISFLFRKREIPSQRSLSGSCLR